MINCTSIYKYSNHGRGAIAHSQNTNRLQRHLADMISIESVIEKSIEEMLPGASTHAGVTTLLTGLQTLDRTRRAALEIRLQVINGAVPLLNEPSVALSGSESSEDASYPVSEALQTAYTLINQAVIGYAVLHPLATRFKDSIYIADEGTSYHLSREHTKNYIEAIQQVSCLLHDVILWELDQENLECQCVCPSCGAGICVCALAGRSFLRDTWVEAGPIADDEGVYIQPPRKDSAAAKVGLHKGDVILAANDQEIESYGELQSVVSDAEPGEEIRLTVKRNADVLDEIAIVRP